MVPGATNSWEMVTCLRIGYFSAYASRYPAFIESAIFFLTASSFCCAVVTSGESPSNTIEIILFMFRFIGEVCTYSYFLKAKIDVDGEEGKTLLRRSRQKET